MNDSTRFAFGQNWLSYVDHALNRSRIVRAATSLQTMLGCEHLIDRTFLDIGCGSGLFSLAACLLGAKQVWSFDYDMDSVRSTQAIRQRFAIDATRWWVGQGSILDDTFMQQLPCVDVVYSWGVLHHTGDMWTAIAKAAQHVRVDGLFALAIYNRVDSRIIGSYQWRSIKRFYNHAPLWKRRLMEMIYAGMFLAKDSLRRQNPLTTITRYNADARGMDFWHDVRDWLGGYPYEYASVAEIEHFVTSKHMFRSLWLQQDMGLGCNQFTFQRIRPV